MTLPPASFAATRRRLGMSQRAVERLMGLGHPTVCQFETGRIEHIGPARMAKLSLAADKMRRALDVWEM